MQFNHSTHSLIQFVMFTAKNHGLNVNFASLNAEKPIQAMCKF